MSRSKRLQQWREEEEESDEDDVVFLGAMLAALKRKKNKKKFRGSLPGLHNVPRDILGGHEKIYWDYFADKPAYNEKYFRRCLADGITMGYYLADGIYPAWASLVKAFRNPQGNKKVHFTTVQEFYRKDIERAFGGTTIMIRHDSRPC